MIFGLYKPYMNDMGFEGSFWRVTDIHLEVGDYRNLNATCTIKCYKNYNMANINPNGFLLSHSLNTSQYDAEGNLISAEWFLKYFEGSSEPVEVQNSYYRFFKEVMPYFADAIYIDSEVPESLVYLGENPEIIMPISMQ